MSLLSFSVRMAVALALCALPMAAQSIDMAATIPFGFEVANISMPAGEYRLVRNTPDTVVMVRSVNSKVRALVLIANSSAPMDAPPTFKLVFYRYGNGSEARNFLRTIWQGWTCTQLIPTRAERQAEAAVHIAKGTRTEVVILAKVVR